MLLALMKSSEGLIRFSAIMERVKAQGESGLSARVEQGVNDADRTCHLHGYLHDPVIGIDLVKKRIIVGCPWCSGEEVLARWEAQEVSDV